MTIDIPIWVAAICSILALAGYLLLGFFSMLESDRYNNGSTDERLFIPIVVTWPIAIPIFLTLVTWTKRRKEEAVLNGLQ